MLVRTLIKEHTKYSDVNTVVQTLGQYLQNSYPVKVGLIVRLFR